jgi:hypothetical protein
MSAYEYTSGSRVDVLHSGLIGDIFEAGWEGTSKILLPAGEIKELRLLPKYVNPLSVGEMNQLLGFQDEPDSPVGFDVSEDEEGVYIEYDGYFTPEYGAMLRAMRLLGSPGPYAQGFEDYRIDIATNPSALRSYRKLVARTIAEDLEQY